MVMDRCGIWGRRLLLLLVLGLMRPACGGGGNGGGGGGGNPGGPPGGIVSAPQNIALSTAIGFQSFVQLVPDSSGGSFAFWIDNVRTIAAQKLSPSGTPLWAANGVALTNTNTPRNFGLAAVTDGAGGAIVIWCDTRTVDASGLDLYAQRIDSNGVPQWTANGVPVLSTLLDIKQPMAVPDGAGGAVVLGLEGSNIRLAHLSSAGASTWAAGGTLTGSNLNQSVRMIGDGAGGAIVSWDSNGSFPLRVYGQRVSSAGALQWTAGGVQVAAAGFFPDLASDGAGGAIFAWSDLRNDLTDGSDIYVQRLNNLGQPQWTAGGQAVATGPGDQIFPRVASDGAGGAIVCFQVPGVDGFYDLIAHRFGPTGSALWAAAGVPVCAAPDNQALDTMTSAGADGVIVVWRDFRSQTSYDLCAQRVTLAGTAAWAVDGVPVSVAAYYQGNASVLAIPGQRVFFAWGDVRVGPGTNDCYGQVLLMNGTSTTGTATVNASTPFQAYNYCLSPIAGDATELVGVPDGSGGAIFAWLRHRASGDGVFAQRVNSAGQPQWGSAGIPISQWTTANPNAPNLGIVSDGAGGVIVAWQEDRIGTVDLYAQRLASDGSLLWGASGVPVVEEADLQGPLQMVADGAAGAVLVWVDNRDSATNSSDLYAQRLNSLGARQWNSHGVPVSATTAQEYQFKIIGDGAGGVLMVWDDNRNFPTTKSDVFAQRIDGAGALAWGAPVVVCNAANDQIDVALVSDGAGGLIVTWSDSRNNTSPPTTFPVTYAQRLNSSGVPQWTANGVLVSPAQSGTTTLVSDGANGAIMVQHSISPTTDSLYALRITSAGATPWASGGVRLTLEFIDSGSFGVIPDGAGGAVTAWGDDLFGKAWVQRVNASGTLLLGTSGAVISNATPHYKGPVLIPGNVGRMISAWRDDRRSPSVGDYLPYAQGLDLNGNP